MSGFGAVKNALRLNKSKLTKMVIHLPSEKSPMKVDHHFADGGVKHFPFENESGAAVAKHIESHIATSEGTHEGVDGSGDPDDGGEGRHANPLRLKQGAWRPQGKS